MARRLRPRVADLPDRAGNQHAPMFTWTRLHDRDNHTTTYTLIVFLPSGGPLYRWMRFSPGETRAEVAAGIRTMRDYLRVKLNMRTVH